MTTIINWKEEAILYIYLFHMFYCRKQSYISYYFNFLPQTNLSADKEQNYYSCLSCRETPVGLKDYYEVVD